jgi:uncharacterized membrane protein
MVIMALDHTRDFFHNSRHDPTDLAHVSAALFLTRLITHLCAPTFVFLAGTSAYLSGASGRSRPSRSLYLITRGLWLILLDITVVRFGWQFNVNYEWTTLGVLWALGWSMIALAGLIWLPLPAIAAIGGGMVLLHNLMDGWGLRETPLPAWLWSILHVPADFSMGPDSHVMFYYSLIPWIGVMALGYVFGATAAAAAAERRARWTVWGVGALAAFVFLRATNLYGNPTPWTIPDGRPPLFAVLAFFNTQKYPPSLLFLLMTLGTMLLLLAAAEGWRPTTALGNRLRAALLTFGRVPLFFYLIHLPLAHTLRVLDHLVRYRTLAPMDDAGYALPGVYVAWLLLLLILYPLCTRYEAYKRAHPEGWTRYV